MKGTERTGAAAMRIGMGRADSDVASGCLLPSSELRSGICGERRSTGWAATPAETDQKGTPAQNHGKLRGIRAPEADGGRGRGLTMATGMTTSPRRSRYIRIHRN